ncbi:MAG: hypothetical protein WBE71_21415, partial [Xanthobacteraceae bacterium]
NELTGLGAALPLVEAGVAGVMCGLAGWVVNCIADRGGRGCRTSAVAATVLAARGDKSRSHRQQKKGDNRESCGGTHGRS